MEGKVPLANITLAIWLSKSPGESTSGKNCPSGDSFLEKLPIEKSFWKRSLWKTSLWKKSFYFEKIKLINEKN